MPIEIGELLQEHRLQRCERRDRGKFDDGFHIALEQHRQHNHVARHHLEQCRADRDCVGRQFGDQEAALVAGALSNQPFPDPQPLRMAVEAIVRVGREQTQPVHAFDLIDDAELRVDQRRQLAEQQPADGFEIALALQHVGKPREVGLQPVLLGVAVGGQPQVVDHRVDVVFELGHLATRLGLNGSRQVALGHGRCHLGDRAHLRR